ncbi:MAG TPA: energy transducer TonB [Pyrinomonadaceae bacterium]|nr:energy transducer TonB [Pyrinomonadaceae bacterium]
MHDCDVTREMLADLLFDELEEGPRLSLLEDVRICGGCSEQYRAMAETLRVMDVGMDACLPAEEFWPGYEERLSERMAAEIQLSFWQQAAPRGEYSLTILEDSGVARRLLKELRAAASASQLTWPEFKRDPFGFAGRSVSAYSQVAWRFFSERNVALATASSFVLVFFIVVGVYALERLRLANAAPEANAASDDYEFAGWVNNTNIPREQERPEEGTPGLSKGKGAGSLGDRKRASGGGGGGAESDDPTSAGKHAPGRAEPQIIAPSVREPKVEQPQLAMSTSLEADPLLIPEDARPIPYGNPDSLSTKPSDGPGKNGGQGTGSGGGQGAGDGKGYGPGRDGNIGGGDEGYGKGGPGGPNGVPKARVDYTKVFTTLEVTRRAVITAKPDPGFTEEARKNGVMGVVRLRAVLSANGAVTRVSVINSLPDGLTERAIQAAQRIKFHPAQKDGIPVSQWITLEYNFNIY